LIDAVAEAPLTPEGALNSTQFKSVVVPLVPQTTVPGGGGGGGGGGPAVDATVPPTIKFEKIKAPVTSGVSEEQAGESSQATLPDQ
jgi:hypothetical protein